MSDNTLIVPTEKFTADVSSVNQFYDAMCGTFHARNNSGEPSELYSVGSDLFPHSAAFVKQLRQVGSLATVEFTSTGEFTVPAGVYRIYVIAAGGGGRYAGGGIAEGYLDVEPTEIYDVTIAGGNATFGESLLVGNVGGSSGGSGDGGKATVDSLVGNYRISQGADGGHTYDIGGSTIYALGGTTFLTGTSSGGGAGFSAGGNGTSTTKGYGGGYTAGSSSAAGSAGVKIRYWL